MLPWAWRPPRPRPRRRKNEIAISDIRAVVERHCRFWVDCNCPATLRKGERNQNGGGRLGCLRLSRSLLLFPIWAPSLIDLARVSSILLVRLACVCACVCVFSDHALREHKSRLFPAFSFNSGYTTLSHLCKLLLPVSPALAQWTGSFFSFLSDPFTPNLSPRGPVELRRGRSLTCRERS